MCGFKGLCVDVGAGMASGVLRVKTRAGANEWGVQGQRLGGCRAKG